MTNNLPTALKYLAKGWSIIPIKPRDKKPLLSSWMPFQERLPTIDEVTYWWTLNPDAGIAIICGKISGVIVVDIDLKEGLPKHTLKLDGPTLSAKSGGGGSHVFYKWRPGLVGAKVGFQEGVDIRSDASYIILAPSTHPSGNQYEWLTDEDEALLAAPVWLEAAAPSAAHREATDWAAFFSNSKGEGIRNMSATKVAGKILFDMSPEMWDTLGLGAFRHWNKSFCEPSLPDDELLNVWESIKKTHVKNNPAPEPSVPTSPTDSAGETEEKGIIDSFKKDKTSGTFYLATHITRKFSVVTIGEKEREMFVYRNGFYQAAENEIINPEIQRILAHRVTKNAKTETFHKIADMTSYPRDVFDTALPRYIPLKNGVFDFETKTLLGHSPSYRFQTQFPITYDPAATCPRFEAFLEQVLTPEQIDTVVEWMGYYFWREYLFKKAIILVGDGDTGKTTLLEALIYMLGKPNISSVSLQKMTGDKFAAAQMYTKHANIVDELSAKDIHDTGQFKIATGGGNITGEYKFGNQFAFKNYSKLTFACNRIPDVKDVDDEAYFNRWMVIRFEKTIEKKIPNFIASLTTESERSGMFNLAMRGLARLLDQGGFSYAKTAAETKTDMMRGGSSIAQFVVDQCEAEQGAEITKEAMYDAYAEYCRLNGFATETIKMFGSKFMVYASYATEGLMNDYKGYGKASRSKAWRNVRLKTVATAPPEGVDPDADIKALAEEINSLPA